MTPTGSSWSQDIEDALRILRPVYDASDGVDGYVSVEVAPALARDTDGTVAAARELHERIAEPNLYVKIPGTAEGIPAIRQMIAEGRSINVTLIFSLERYEEVMEAYLTGLEAYDGDLRPVSSVASFFVSRVDTEVDRRLDEIGTPEALALRGQGRRGPGPGGLRPLPGDASRDPGGRRWPRGAPGCSGRCGPRPRPRTRPTPTPSTSTRSSARTRSTPCPTPPSRPSRTTAPSPAPSTPTSPGPGRSWTPVERSGVDLDDVAGALEDEGVAAFAKSFDELLGTLRHQGRAARRLSRGDRPVA